MVSSASPDTEPDYVVEARWIGVSTLVVASIYAAVAVFLGSMLYLHDDLGLAALAAFGIAVAAAVGSVVFLGTGLAVLVKGDAARKRAAILHIVAAVLTVPVGTIPHGLVAWLARRRETTDADGAAGTGTVSAGAEVDGPSPPGDETRGSSDEWGSILDLPFGIVLIVAFLGIGALGALVELLTMVGLFAASPSSMPVELLALFGAMAVGFATVASGLALRERWGYWLLHVLLVVLAVVAFVRPWVLLVFAGILWYLHRSSVKQVYLAADQTG